MKRLRFFVLGLLALLIAQPALAAIPPTSAFNRVWERYDRPVTEGQSNRSWTWGPRPNSGILEEQYITAQASTRAVQYWDKGRMELNDPNADPTDPWLVTGGLLPVELMFTRQQLGDDRYERPRMQDGWRPTESYVAAIGDPLSFPAYPDLQPLYESPGTISSEEIGKPVTDLFNPDLTVGAYTSYSNDPGTVLVKGANNHGVPRAFVDFMNQQGTLYADNSYTTGQVYDPLFVFGLPITPAVWVTTRIGGISATVLFQVFERRLLTYNPLNPSAFRVEMGNVGQHYHKWRYNPEETTEWVYDNVPTPEVRFTSSPGAMYILEQELREVPSGAPNDQGPPSRKYVTFRIYFSPDNGKTRELRYSQEEFGGCYRTSVDLLAPRTPFAGTNRLGLYTQCADNPSMGRGLGITILSSYTGGRTFVERFQY